MSRRVGIVGAGPFGTALGHVVAGSGREVLLLTRDASVAEEINRDHRNSGRLPGVKLDARLRATGDIAEVARLCEFLVLALSADDVRRRARELGDHLSGAHLVVHAIGGHARPDEVPVSEVLSEELPTHRIGALAGPAMASDLASGRVSSMVCASHFDEVSAAARELLAVPPVLRIYRSRDLHGVELASSLAGAYTVALGLADGLGVGSGTRAVLITRTVAEASRLGEAVGADPWTFAGLAGLGNLLVRGSDGESSSEEYHYGLRLARGDELGRPPAGVLSLGSLHELAESKGRRAPVLGALAGITSGRMSPSEAAAAIADTVAQQE